MTDFQLTLQDADSTISADGLSDNTIDLHAIKDSYGDTLSFDKINSAYINIVASTDWTGTSGNTIAINLVTDDTAAGTTTSDVVSTLVSATQGDTIDAGDILYSGTIPVNVERFIALAFDETGTVTGKLAAWISNSPVTDNGNFS